MSGSPGRPRSLADPTQVALTSPALSTADLPPELAQELTTDTRSSTAAFDDKTLAEEVTAHLHASDVVTAERQVHGVRATTRGWADDDPIEDALALMPRSLARLSAEPARRFLARRPSPPSQPTRRGARSGPGHSPGRRPQPVRSTILGPSYPRMDLRILLRMSERITVSFGETVARRVRQCGERTRGGASGYLERLVRQDELREALKAHGRWFDEHPGYEADAHDEAVAGRDASR